MADSSLYQSTPIRIHFRPRCRDEIRHQTTVKMSSDSLAFFFLPFFFYWTARGRNLKTAAPEMCDTLRQHKSHLVLCCDSISCKTERHVSSHFHMMLLFGIKIKSVWKKRKEEEKNLAVSAASIHVAKQQKTSYRSQYTATRETVIGCRWLKPERWQDSLRDSPAEFDTTSSWILFLLYFNQCLSCADPRAKLSQVHTDIHTHTLVLRVQLFCRSTQSLPSSLEKRFASSLCSYRLYTADVTGLF